MTSSIKKNNKNQAGRKTRRIVRQPSRNTNAGVRRVVAPAASGAVVTTAAPKFNGGTTSCRICHRELVTGMMGSAFGAFAPSGYIINPGRSMFPWLSQIAPSFEKYEINKLTFTYMPTCSTAQIGHVRAFIDYDPLDECPASVFGFAQMEGLVYGPVWTSLSLQYRAPCRQQLFTAVTGAVEDRLADAGTLYFYNESTAGYAIGEWWVDYDVTFYKAQYNDLSPLHVAGDAIDKTITDCPGPGVDGVFTKIGTYTSILPQICPVLEELGLPYDFATHILGIPANTGKQVQRLLINVCGHEALNPAPATPQDLVRAAAVGTTATVTNIEELSYMTDTTAPDWQAQIAYDVNNNTDYVPGQVTLDFKEAGATLGIEDQVNLRTTLTRMYHEDL